MYTEDDAEYLRSIANVMKTSGCDVPEWMLQMKKISRKDKKHLAAHAPHRESVSTVATIDKFKGNRNKKKLLETVGYREPRPVGRRDEASDSGATDAVVDGQTDVAAAAAMFLSGPSRAPTRERSQDGRPPSHGLGRHQSRGQGGPTKKRKTDDGQSA